MARTYASSSFTQTVIYNTFFTPSSNNFDSVECFSHNDFPWSVTLNTNGDLEGIDLDQDICEIFDHPNTDCHTDIPKLREGRSGAVVRLVWLERKVAKGKRGNWCGEEWKGAVINLWSSKSKLSYGYYNKTIIWYCNKSRRGMGDEIKQSGV